MCLFVLQYYEGTISLGEVRYEIVGVVNDTINPTA